MLFVTEFSPSLVKRCIWMIFSKKITPSKWFVPSAGFAQMTLLLSPVMITCPACPGSEQRAGGIGTRWRLASPTCRSPPPPARQTRSPAPSGLLTTCAPPLKWSRPSFGEDDPAWGWEGRGNLQQRQCRPDTKSCQHLSGEQIFGGHQHISGWPIIGGCKFVSGSWVFGGEMAKRGLQQNCKIEKWAPKQF